MAKKMRPTHYRMFFRTAQPAYDYYGYVLEYYWDGYDMHSLNISIVL